MAVIAFGNNDQERWLRCTHCRTAHVVNGAALSPGHRPLSVPLGVDGVELETWNETRDCLSVGAYTAAVMLCRKLLFHVAVGAGLPEANDKGHAPTFVACVKHLEDEGIITTRMRPWVDRIKDVGNEANHVITPISEQTALDVARFTEQVLRLSYEMEALVNGVTSSAEDTRE